MLQNWVILHSIIYYELDKSIVSDYMFDNNCKQLVQMMQEYPGELTQTTYFYMMSDFDGSTGFDLPGKVKKQHRDVFDISINMLLEKRK